MLLFFVISGSLHNPSEGFFINYFDLAVGEEDGEWGEEERLRQLKQYNQALETKYRGARFLE